MKTHGALPTDS